MKAFILLILFFISKTLLAQTTMLSNQGALISVKNNAFVSVHGDTRNDNNGSFHNSSQIHLYGDWENNVSNEGFISSGEGIVHFQGDDQWIKGTEITRFYDVRMENTGVKYAELDVYVDGYLNLFDREFNLDTNTTHVFNTAINAVLNTQGNTWGFVSSLGDGGLLRHTADTIEYIYPVGSALGTTRVRPVKIKPESAAAAAFKVRMANVDATTEGWDRSLTTMNICEVNPLFFHRITRSAGTQAATVQIMFDAATDGPFSDIGKWVVSNMWDEAATATASVNTTYNLDTRTSIIPVSDFSPNPFALVRRSPDAQLTVAPDPICADQSATLTATSAGTAFSNYDFFVDGFLVQSGASDSYILSNSPAGNIPLWVIGSIPECGDESDTVFLTVLPLVTAAAYADTIIIQGTSANLSATGGDFYNWLPDTALSCNICSTTMASPLHTTLYTVEVENMEGCKDTASVLVDVRQDLNTVLFIPNVLTPNNDGFNDTWFIKNIDLFPKNAVRIVSRWGDEVFSTNNYQNNWDGTYGNGLLPAGTYYYILDAGGQWGIIKGDVTILRE